MAWVSKDRDSPFQFFEKVLPVIFYCLYGNLNLGRSASKETQYPSRAINFISKLSGTNQGLEFI